MPTLQRYKRLYQERIPAHGLGRKQRYPREALQVFQEIKAENLARRGRPRKNQTNASHLVSQKKVASHLLTLSEICRRTGISYPTLLRYVRLHLKDIPHEGIGRSRRFHPEAVEVFRTLRSQSRRGRKPKAETQATRETLIAANRSLADRIQQLESTQADLAEELRNVLQVLQQEHGRPRLVK